jgi:hypothetical protein
MNSRSKYFDSRGSEISADDAFDRNGALRDGFAIRVPLMLRDSMRSRDAKLQFSDGSGIIDPAAGLRPGFRVKVGDNRRAVNDALAEYEAELTNRWRDGGYYSDKGELQNATSGPRHQQMDQVYQEYDRQLANAWRQS